MGEFSQFGRSALSTLADYVNQKLKAWIMRKFKRFQSHKTRASLFLRKLARENLGLFVHWNSAPISAIKPSDKPSYRSVIPSLARRLRTPN